MSALLAATLRLRRWPRLSRALVALAYRDFGYLDPLPQRALQIGGVWLALVVLAAIFGALKKTFTSRPAAIPTDVAKELDSHPE